MEEEAKRLEKLNTVFTLEGEIVDSKGTQVIVRIKALYALGTPAPTSTPNYRNSYSAKPQERYAVFEPGKIRPTQNNISLNVRQRGFQIVTRGATTASLPVYEPALPKE